MGAQKDIGLWMYAEKFVAAGGQYMHAEVTQTCCSTTRVVHKHLTKFSHAVFAWF